VSGRGLGVLLPWIARHPGEVLLQQAEEGIWGRWLVCPSAVQGVAQEPRDSGAVGIGLALEARALTRGPRAVEGVASCGRCKGPLKGRKGQPLLLGPRGEMVTPLIFIVSAMMAGRRCGASFARATRDNTGTADTDIHFFLRFTSRSLCFCLAFCSHFQISSYRQPFVTNG